MHCTVPKLVIDSLDQDGALSSVGILFLEAVQSGIIRLSFTCLCQVSPLFEYKYRYLFEYKYRFLFEYKYRFLFEYKYSKYSRIANPNTVSWVEIF